MKNEIVKFLDAHQLSTEEIKDLDYVSSLIDNYYENTGQHLLSVNETRQMALEYKQSKSLRLPQSINNEKEANQYLDYLYSKHIKPLIK